MPAVAQACRKIDRTCPVYDDLCMDCAYARGSKAGGVSLKPELTEAKKEGGTAETVATTRPPAHASGSPAPAEPVNPGRLTVRDPQIVPEAWSPRPARRTFQEA